MAELHPAHLAARACDAISFVADHQQAYEAVERLLATQSGNPNEDLSHLERVQLQYLLLTLNAAMRERIAEADEAVQAVYQHVYGGSHAH